MRHGRYLLGLVLALLSGLAVAFYAIIFGPEWTCKSDVACEHLYPWWCTPYYVALAFGPAVLVVAWWLRAWSRGRKSSQIVG